MSFRNKVIVIVLIACMAVGIIYVGHNNNIQEEETKAMSYYQTETVYLWYTDDIYTDFFTNAAVEFHEENPDVRVIPTLVSSAEYLERINEASLGDDNFPDVYMLTNDSLEKAYLSGLASKIDDVSNVLTNEYYGEGALSAVTYRGKYVAYPFSYDTCVLLYNKTYLNDWVEKVNSGEITSSDEGDLMDDEGNVLSDEEMGTDTEAKTVKLGDYIPDSFDDIINFADEYEAADGVDAILEWDVSDIFFNYLFLGDYMVVGGDSGDDSTNIDIYNDNTLACVTAYQNLNQVFSFDASTSDYDDVLADFLDGKTVFTLVTSDAIQKVNDAVAANTEEVEKRKAQDIAASLAEDDADAEAAESEETTSDTSADSSSDESDSEDLAETADYTITEYGYAVVPDVTDELESRSLSVTNTLVVNGYSTKKEAANRFAAYVSNDLAKEIYDKTGKLAASKKAEYTDEGKATFAIEYEQSIPLPKIVEASNLWVQLEITLSDIWNGDDADTRLKEFSDQISSQVVSE